MRGKVIKSTGSFHWIVDEEGNQITCRLKGNIRLKNYKFTNPVAVGDEVVFEPSVGKEGLIEEILPRRNYIIRRSVKLSKQAHIIASNIDQAILVVTLAEPKTYAEFIDRYLVTAEAYHIPAILLFNKTDIYQSKEREELKFLMEIYLGIGYPCLAISASSDKDLDQVKELLQGKTTLFSGYSGVGKSTIVNRIDPSLNLRTGDISTHHGSGKHTTTNAEMHELKGVGFIIDTPGIKGLGVLDIRKEELSHYFLEMRAVLANCKYNNCVHIDEPGCAVKEAVEMGKIAESRYRSYLKIYYDEEGESYR